MSIKEEIFDRLFAHLGNERGLTNFLPFECKLQLGKSLDDNKYEKYDFYFIGRPLNWDLMYTATYLYGESLKLNPKTTDFHDNRINRTIEWIEDQGFNQSKEEYEFGHKNHSVNWKREFTDINEWLTFIESLKNFKMPGTIKKFKDLYD
jgi:hypothetical protein